MKRLKSTFKNKKYYDSQIFLYQMGRMKHVSFAIFKNSFFMGLPVVTTPCFQCRDIGSIPSQGSHMPHCVAKKKKKKKEKAYFDHSNDLLMLYIKCSNKEY